MRMEMPTETLKKYPLYIHYAGNALLELPLLNKGSAFTEEERTQFNLHGLIPHVIESIEEQSQRSYQQYCSFSEAINKHIYLRNIQDTNETLFYHLIENHLSEMMPIIYTPTVGEACQRFRIFIDVIVAYLFHTLIVNILMRSSIMSIVRMLK